jgi:DNA-binding MarR family transcriptional regulator
VLVVIADTCNAEEKWQGYPSVTAIAERTGFSRKAVSSSLKSLKDKGLISTLPGYTGRCSHYIIHIEKIADARYATRAELDKRKESEKAVDKVAPAVQQSLHQQGVSHPDYDDDEELDTPF